jgi:hypothetical protein
MVPFRKKQKNGQVLQTPKNQLEKRFEKPVEKPVEKSLNKIDTQTIELIESTIEDICDDYGWAFLGDVGNLIVKKT